MDALEGRFGSVATTSFTGKNDLHDPVATNLALIKVVANLDDINAFPVKKLGSLTNNNIHRRGGIIRGRLYDK
jgi:hypothetical protein